MRQPVPPTNAHCPPSLLHTSRLIAAGTWREPVAMPRVPARGRAVAASLVFLSSATRSVNARSKIAAGSPSRNRVPQKVLRPAEFLVYFTRHGELDFVPELGAVGETMDERFGTGEAEVEGLVSCGHRQRRVVRPGRWSVRGRAVSPQGTCGLTPERQAEDAAPPRDVPPPVCSYSGRPRACPDGCPSSGDAPGDRWPSA